MKELLEQTLQTPKQKQWLPKLFGYDFTVQYKFRKENIPTDHYPKVFLWQGLDLLDYD